jgi:hypothetical protein
MRRLHIGFRRWHGIAGLLASLLLLSTVAAVFSQNIPSSSTIVVTIDSPGAGSSITNGQPIFIGGWAADSAGGGTGIDRIEVYVDSASGARIGRARYGTSRPDVARAWSQPAWTDSGFALDWRPQNLLAGDHALVVVAYSTSGTSATTSIGFTAVSDEPTTGCRPSPTCPRYIRTPAGWEVDTGGPGTRADRDPDSFRR